MGLKPVARMERDSGVLEGQYYESGLATGTAPSLERLGTD